MGHFSAMWEHVQCPVCVLERYCHPIPVLAAPHDRQLPQLCVHKPKHPADVFKDQGPVTSEETSQSWHHLEEKAYISLFGSRLQLPGAEMPRVHSALPSEVCRQGSPWQQVRPERGIFWLLADVISSYFKRQDCMYGHTDTHACTYTSVYKQIER